MINIIENLHTCAACVVKWIKSIKVSNSGRWTIDLNVFFHVMVSVYRLVQI